MNCEVGALVATRDKLTINDLTVKHITVYPQKYTYFSLRFILFCCYLCFSESGLFIYIIQEFFDGNETTISEFWKIRVTSLVMTSSNGNIFRVIDPLWGEFTGLRWIPRTKASDAEL